MFENVYSELNETAKDPFISSLIKAGIAPHDQRQTVYKYFSLSTAKIILNNCTIRFSSPLIFNDPFEMNLGFLDYSVNRKELVERLVKIRALQNKELTRQQKNKLESLSDLELVAPYLKAFELQKKQALIFCTSRTNSSTLMWSHYADNHKGICIGFIMPTIYPDLDMFTFNVKYISEIESLEVLQGNDMERSVTFFKWLFYKSNIWEYENEVRTCIPNLKDKLESSQNLYYDLAFDPSQICELYFGVGSTEEDMNSVNDLIKSNGYKLNQSGKFEISKNTFDLKLNSF